MATKQVKIRRGTDTQHGSFTGVVGEITVDTTNYSLRVHDAFTTGGHELARADGSNIDDFSVGGDLTITGNLTVQGTTTTIESTTLNVEDKNIILNYGTGDTSASANGAGITIQDAVNSTTDATILWDTTNDEFDFSHNINISGIVTTKGGSYPTGYSEYVIYKQIGTTSDSVNPHYILIAPYDTGASGQSTAGVDGVFLFDRGGAGAFNIYDHVDVACKTAYSSTILDRYIARHGFDLDIVTYNSVDYVAIYVPQTSRRIAFFTGNIHKGGSFYPIMVDESAVTVVTDAWKDSDQLILARKTGLGIDNNNDVYVYNDLNITGTVTSGDITMPFGTTAKQSVDKIYIGGNGLDSADAAIYIGNGGNGTGYGYRLYYSGVGAGNNNKFIIQSENLGSTVNALTFTADGNATFAGSITASGLSYPTSDGTNGQVLTTDGAGNLSFIDASGGASTLDELTDTNLTTPADGSLLFYDSGTSKWIDNPTTNITSVGTLDGLTVDGLAEISAQTNGAYALRIGDAQGSSGSVVGIGKIGINPQDAGAFTYTGTEIRATENSAGDYRARLSFHTRGSSSDVEPLERLRIDQTGDISFYEDTGTTAKLFWDSSTESLGIGTTSPDKALTISASDSQVRLYDADGTNQFASFQSDNGIAKITSRNNTSNGQIAFQRYDGTTVSESMRLSSAGYLGINTSSPSNLLHVASADATVAHFQHTDGINSNIRISDTSDSFYLVSRDGIGSIGGVNSVSTSNVNIDLTSGYVGIGINSPSTALDVAGDVTIEGETLTLGDSSTFFSIYQAIDSQSLGISGGNDYNVGANAFFYGSTHATRANDFRLRYNSTDVIEFDYSAQSLILSTGGSEAMRIDSSLNVGVGCIPTYRLHVQHNQDASTPTMSIVNDSTGTSAAARLQFDADGNNFNIYNWGDATSKANATEFNSTAGSSYFIFSPSNSERLRLDSTGLRITSTAVPITFNEEGNTGNGQWWRMPLDGGNLRFDVSLSGDASFSPYDNILQLNSDGTIDIQQSQMFDSSGNISTTKTITSGAITSTGQSYLSNALGITGTSTGTANVSYIQFLESNKSTRQGYIGYGSTGNSSLYINNDVDADVLIRINNDIRATFSSAGLEVDNVVKVNSVESGNPTPTTDNVHLSGYGIIGNRGTVYVTNASGGDVQIGNGTSHNSNAIATFGSGGLNLDGDIAITQSSDTSVGLTIDRNSATGRAQMVLATETGGELWRFGLTGGASEDFTFFDGGANVLILDRSSDEAIFGGKIICNGNQITLDNVASRDKYRVWDSTLYTIGMDSAYTFGALNNDYAMTFQMNNDNDRGFWFGDDQHTKAQGAMSLTTQGNMTLASSLRVGFGESDTSSATNGNTLQVLGNQVFGSAGVGASTSGAWLSFEGNADAGGEGSGRLFFREHNSTTTDMDDYGVSFGYRGGGTSVTTAGGNTWTGLSAIGNGEWGMWGHDNSLAGALIMSGSRDGSSVRFTDDCDLQMWNSSSTAATTRIDMPRAGFITFYGNSSTDHSICSRSETGIVSDDLRINSYGSLIINLDANNNNSDNADLIIGRHGGGTGTVDELWRFSGENNSLTTESDYFMFSTTDTTLYNNGAAGNEGVLFSTGDTIQVARISNYCALFNRMSTDGAIVGFYQNGTLEGYINVSGTTVSLVGFTGSHWSRLPDNTKPDIPKGTILESLDEMVEWYMVEFTHTWITHEKGEEVTNTSFKREPYVLQEGESEGDVVDFEFEGITYQATIVKEQNDKHVQAKISDTVESKTVYGVFEQWDEDDDMVNDMLVATTGSFVIRMHADETVQKGDLIQSNGDGTGKVQADDLVRASTVAKILSNTVCETYDDGSYTVPCSLLVG